MVLPCDVTRLPLLYIYINIQSVSRRIVRMLCSRICRALRWEKSKVLFGGVVDFRQNRCPRPNKILGKSPPSPYLFHSFPNNFLGYTPHAHHIFLTSLFFFFLSLSLSFFWPYPLLSSCSFIRKFVGNSCRPYVHKPITAFPVGVRKYT